MFIFVLQLQLVCVWNTIFKEKLISTYREINIKLFLILPLKLAHVLFGDHVFLTMGIV
jgi:hypothetical protein